MPKYKTTTAKLRVRLTPNGAIVGNIAAIGTQLEVIRIVGDWAQLPVTAGGALLSAGRVGKGALWVDAKYIAPVISTPPTPTPTPTPPPPPTSAPTGSYRIGLNALQNTREAMVEANLGCEFFLIMDDFGGAANIKSAHPSAIVMARRYFPQRFFLTPDQVMHGLEGATFGGLVYIGFNEADQGGQDGEALRTRARIDVEVARRIRARHGANYGVGKTFYAAGTFSMGTPDFTSEETCRIIREEYAPHYNSGLLGLDMHLYSPNMQHIDKPTEHQWFERRWEFLFTRCGFDPNVRAIYCSETGLDEGGIGGFPAHGATHQYFSEWVRKNNAVQNAPLVVNGVQYQSPALGGAIFQLGGNGDRRWEGYNVASYLPALRPFYGGRK